MVVHHLAAATRLRDVAPLIEEDHRIQVVYTVPPSSRFAAGAHDFLRTTGALEMPFAQALETRFDLAVAAGQGMLDRLRSPVMTLFHGAGPNSYVTRRDGHGPLASRAITGLGFQALTMHGRVVPSAIMLGHEDQRALLAGQCPEALPAAVVAGDPCFDRMLASRHLRTAYRNALGAGPGQKVLVVSSHYGAGSLLSRYPGLPARLSRELPPGEYRVALVLHPAVWTTHGARQVTAWFADCERRGVVLLPPEEGWRAALVAADVMLADRGSPACYGAALGVPVLLTPHDSGDVLPGSQFARLAGVAPRLRVDEPLVPQLEAARAGWPLTRAPELRAALTSVPGGAAGVLRRTMYRLMRLPEPSGPPVAARPLPGPLPPGPPVR
ncbi:hypothetical protein [Sphaerisporangium rhizosphaerae]|uniref:Translation initiation factor 2 n=1 Tax=Sphaerisporangium rhizosphaerae TaxID=2269375 RepID=A0ABW2PCY3_9ACTN